MVFKTLKPAIATLFSTIALTACSSADEPRQPGENDSNAIRFAANTEYSRAKGDITTNNLTSFNVYAYTGLGTSPVTFMDNVKVTKTGANTWTYSPIKYWPANEDVDFYAFSPEGWVGTTGPLKPVPYDSSTGLQDLVYAVSPNLSGNEGMANAQVLFNFRHALTKITVKMSSTDANIQVKVSNVALANLMTRGNFRFPTASTAEKPSEYTLGSWTDQNTPQTYMLHMSQTPDDVIILSTTSTDMAETGMGLGGPKYLIPQTLTWRSNGAGAQDTYITVMCSVYDTKSGTKLWPNANTPSENIVEGSTFGDGLLKFPLSSTLFSEWHPGYHYVYNLVINSNSEMGAIEFGNPKVDSYVDVTTTYQ